MLIRMEVRVSNNTNIISIPQTNLDYPNPDFILFINCKILSLRRQGVLFQFKSNKGIKNIPNWVLAKICSTRLFIDE